MDVSLLDMASTLARSRNRTWIKVPGIFTSAYVPTLIQQHFTLYSTLGTLCTHVDLLTNYRPPLRVPSDTMTQRPSCRSSASNQSFCATPYFWLVVESADALHIIQLARASPYEHGGWRGYMSPHPGK